MTTQPTALNAYIDAQQHAHALLAQLAAQLEAHQNALDPEKVHWGHVGDMTRIVADLSALVRAE